MINVENLSKKYQSVLILDNITFNIPKGALAVIYGKNGAGKTTLIKALVKLIDVDKGNVKIIPNDKSELGIYLGFEMLIEKLTVKEYISLSAILKGVSTKDAESKVLELSKQLFFDEYLDYLITNVSLGTKTKILFTASIINNPKVLIMDEPFIGVDLLTLNQIIILLKDLKNRGCTIFMSSNQVNILDDIIDIVLVINNSKLVVNDFIKNFNFLNSSQFSDFIINKIK